MARKSLGKRIALSVIGVFMLIALLGVQNAESQDRRPFAPAPAPPNRKQPSGSPFQDSGRQLGVGGRTALEEYYQLIVDQIFRQTGKRDETRGKRFDPKEWVGVERLVRVERSPLPVFETRGWKNSNNLSIMGVADEGELFALVKTENVNVIAIPNPFDQHPDENGIWYQVCLLEGKQGWILAVPRGQEGTPFARAYKNENGQLTELRNTEAPRGETETAGRTDATQQIIAARSQGAKAGNNDGFHAGDAEGYKMGFASGKESSFRQTLSESYASGEYHRVPIFSFGVVVAAFLFGFAVQYGVVYLLRITTFLSDIDGIVCPQRAIKHYLSVKRTETDMT
jgi:hypothetical protein